MEDSWLDMTYEDRWVSAFHEEDDIQITQAIANGEICACCESPVCGSFEHDYEEDEPRMRALHEDYFGDED